MIDNSNCLYICEEPEVQRIWQVAVFTKQVVEISLKMDRNKVRILHPDGYSTLKSMFCPRHSLIP